MRLSTNEYTYGQQANPAGTISMTKIKNRLKKDAPELEIVTFSNQRVNGILEGASGFVRNPEGGQHVYISSAHGRDGEILVRRAKGPKDYTGESNHFTTFDEFIDTVRELAV